MRGEFLANESLEQRHRVFTELAEEMAEFLVKDLEIFDHYYYLFDFLVYSYDLVCVFLIDNKSSASSKCDPLESALMLRLTSIELKKKKEKETRSLV